jgi:hypothetical protein
VLEGKRRDSCGLEHRIGLATQLRDQLAIAAKKLCLRHVLLRCDP